MKDETVYHYIQRCVSSLPFQGPQPLVMICHTDTYFRQSASSSRPQRSRDLCSRLTVKYYQTFLKLVHTN